MLILTRRIGETIVIGDNLIKVSIASVQGNQVRLCIDAPREISVDREEIHLRKQQGIPKQPA
ncbi:MAG: carbon storage regulator CsrA [Shewanellaceae bacterium]|nr:carbon storage regulator CsrA [Shewanellaceae bacterium]